MRHRLSHRGVVGDLLSDSDPRSQSTLISEHPTPSPRRPTWVIERYAPGLEASRLTVQKPPKARRRKRLMDLTLAAVLIGFSAPVMALIALAVSLDGGPALYAHRRVGPDGQFFRCWKFRSMVTNGDAVFHRLLVEDDGARQEWEACFKLRSDPRVTPIGKFLRAFSLDELPQLFNVVAGTMSLVGPRPIVEAEIERYGPGFAAYCSCRPGITGLWQVHGRSDVDYSRRVDLDQRYARQWSLYLDFAILMKTVIVITRRVGAY
jgi:exopolysaccharide production protein ExoY